MADTLDYYFPRLSQVAPGCPEMVLADATLRAMTYVARESRALRMEFTTPYVQSQAAYTFTSDGFRIMDFAKVWFLEDDTVAQLGDADIVPLEKKSRADLSLLVAEDGMSNSRPDYWMNSDGQEVSIYPYEISNSPANAAVRCLAVVFPVRPAAQTYVIDTATQHWAAAPDNFFWDHEEAIHEQAAAYLLGMPEKGWTNLRQSAAYWASAGNRIARIKSLADDDGQPNVHRAVRYGGY